MYSSNVIDIKNRIKAKQLIECFDLNLQRLREFGADSSGIESEAATMDLLSEWLEEAIENGASMAELQGRANSLAQYALQRGYSYDQVEELLTMRPFPNHRARPR